VPLKLLLDENLSPRVASTLCKDGVDAAAVRDRGLNGATDALVFQYAFDDDRIVVTKNVRDFEKLAQSCDLHAGVILLEDTLRYEGQLERLRKALTEIELRGDLVNTVLRIAEDGSMTFEPAP
jgi:predicted nuclease of predicted toxin-antitoxin system